MGARGPRRGAVCPLCSCRSRTARARCPAHGLSSSAIWSSSPSVRPVRACTIARARWKSPKDTASRSPQARTPTSAAVQTPMPGERAQGPLGLSRGALGQPLQGLGSPGRHDDRACPSRVDPRPMPGPTGDPRPAGAIRGHARAWGRPNPSRPPPPNPLDPGPAHRTRRRAPPRPGWPRVRSRAARAPRARGPRAPVPCAGRASPARTVGRRPPSPDARGRRSPPGRRRRPAPGAAPRARARHPLPTRGRAPGIHRAGSGWSPGPAGVRVARQTSPPMIRMVGSPRPWPSTPSVVDRSTGHVGVHRRSRAPEVTGTSSHPRWAVRTGQNHHIGRALLALSDHDGHRLTPIRKSSPLVLTRRVYMRVISPM